MTKTSYTDRFVLLDLSGTIIDDLKVTWLIFCDMLRYFDKQIISLVEFQELFSLPFWKIFIELGIECIEPSLFIQLYKTFFPRYAHNVSLFGDVRNFLRKSSELNMQIGLVSQTPLEQINYYLEKFKLKKFFPTIVPLEDSAEPKPSPLSLLIAAERMSVDPHECIYVGDMVADIIAAKHARMIPLAVYRDLGSYNTRMQLLRARPRAIISSLEEVLDIGN